MIRTLLIITGAGLVLCIAALSGAAALGGNDLAVVIEAGLAAAQAAGRADLVDESDTDSE